MVTVNARPVPVINGSSNTCQGTTNNVYTTQSGNSSYSWTVSAGGTITAGSNSSSITVTWSTAGSKTVTVNYINPSGCQSSNPASFTVNVAPATTPSITGPASLCAGATGVIYTTEPGYSDYQWTISYNGIITSGFNTNIVTVNWPTAGSRYIAVSYTNPSGCSAVAPTYKNVTVLEILVPMIFGQDSVCQGTAGIAYNTQAGNSNYIWSVSTGGTITAGSGTNTILANWTGSGAQTVSVNYTNAVGCSASQPTVFSVAVEPLPGVGGTITGPASLCAGSTSQVYTVPAIANATAYHWTVPTGATITAGATTNSITVNYASTAASGIIKVNGVNTCGNGANSPNFNVTVNPIPNTPVITKVGDTLISSAAAGNQWYRNGVVIPGATGKKYSPVYLGTYTVIVAINGCSSAVSNSIVVSTITAIPDLKEGPSFEVYPNPSLGLFKIKLITARPAEYTVEVYNSIGALQWKQEKIFVDGTYTATIDLQKVPAGMYMVTLRSSTTYIVKKMVVNK